MYYLLNQSNQLIAADETLLQLCEVSDIHELNKQIILETITFIATSDTKIEIKNKTKSYNLPIRKTLLSTLLGDLTLVVVEMEPEALSAIEDTDRIDTIPIEQKDTPSTEETNETDSVEIEAEALSSKKDTNEIDIDSLIIKQPDTQEPPTVIHDIEKELLDNSEALEPIKDTTPDTIPTPSQEPIYINVSEISQEIGISEDDFNAFLNEYITTALDLEKDLQKDNDSQAHKDAINTLSHLSEVLQLNTIGTIVNNIEKSTSHTRKQHINALYDALSRITTTEPKIVRDTEKTDEKEMLLDLDNIPTDTVESVIPSDKTDKKEMLLDLDNIPANTVQTNKREDTETEKDDLFILDFDTDIPTDKKPEESITKDVPASSEKFELDFETTPTQKRTEKEPSKQDTVDLVSIDELPSKLSIDSVEETPKKESMVLNTPSTHDTIEQPSKKVKKSTTFGELDLSKVEPIHFDFSLHTAAEELSLPESLIEEFMLDFVEQAHTETDKMLVAYKNGDLDTIQKIGHLLKGVSSNLRITALADTLYNIQFCENSDNLESLIKNYWGHFLAFEKQIKPHNK